MTYSPGDKVGRYEILASIGAGGMGEVFRARDPRLGREVAIKVLPALMAQDPDRLARFQREARAVAALNHPHIVTIYSVEEVEGVHFLTMELVDGRPLDQLICADGLPAQQIMEIAKGLADALASAHDKGIVHRDLKPANIMLTNDGRIKVLDFGLAKVTNADNPSDSTLTSAGHTALGVVMGTPAYMSPEQIAGRVIDSRADIFSFGVILYEMASGRRPFEGDSSAELASAILRDTPRPLREICLGLPSNLFAVIERCLRKSPENRFPAAKDVSAALRTEPAKATSIDSLETHSHVAIKSGSGAARAELGEGF